MATRQSLGYTKDTLRVGEQIVPKNTPVSFENWGVRYRVRVILGELEGLAFDLDLQTAENCLVECDNWRTRVSTH